MGKILKWAAAGLVALVLLAAGVGLLFFKFVQRKIAANMQPPHLMPLREVSSDLSYRTLDGEPQHLASAKGQVVFLDLWGTWCVQCVAEMPTVQKLYDHYKDDPQVKFLILGSIRLPPCAPMRAVTTSTFRSTLPWTKIFPHPCGSTNTHPPSFSPRTAIWLPNTSELQTGPTAPCFHS